MEIFVRTQSEGQYFAYASCSFSECNRLVSVKRLGCVKECVLAKTATLKSEHFVPPKSDFGRLHTLLVACLCCCYANLFANKIVCRAVLISA